MIHRTIILILFLFSISLADDNQFDSKGNYQITRGDTTAGDYFFAGADLEFAGHARSDLYVFSRSVRFEGTTGDDMWAFCQDIEVKGEVTGNLWAAGETVEISGIVKGDVFAGSGTVFIRDGAVVEGTLNAGTGYLNFAQGAVIKGDLLVGAGRADLAGKVEGKTVLQLGEVSFEESFASADSVYLTLEKELDGPIANAPENLVISFKQPERFYTCGYFYWMMISAIIIALIILALFPEIPGRLNDIALPEVLQNFGLGALILFLTPFVIILSIAILPAAFIFLGLYAILIYMSGIFTAIVIGEIFLKDYLNVYLRTSVTLLVIYFIYEIPIIGTLLSFIMILFGMGLFINYLWKLRKGRWLAA